MSSAAACSSTNRRSHASLRSLASTPPTALSNDRSVTLFDLRTGSAMQKAVMQTRGNALAWNPMEPFHFTLASEDHCLYTFDSTVDRLDAPTVCAAAAPPLRRRGAVAAPPLLLLSLWPTAGGSSVSRAAATMARMPRERLLNTVAMHRESHRHVHAAIALATTVASRAHGRARCTAKDFSQDGGYGGSRRLTAPVFAVASRAYGRSAALLPLLLIGCVLRLCVRLSVGFS